MLITLVIVYSYNVFVQKGKIKKKSSKYEYELTAVSKTINFI